MSKYIYAMLYCIININRHYLDLTDQIYRKSITTAFYSQGVYYRCKLDWVNLKSLELLRIYNEVIMVYKIFHGLVNINANELIIRKPLYLYYISTRGHSFKRQTSLFKLDVANNQFCNRVVCNWNNLPDSIVATDTIVHFKKALRTVHFEAALTFKRHC